VITKAVIPAAGAGTRLLPATKSQPKEMLPILDTPAIQYVVQEAVDAGIRDILIVTGRGKRAIEDHVDRSPELEAHLEGGRDVAALSTIRSLGEMARIHYVRQPTQAGLGDAIAQTEAFVGREPFAVLLGDTILEAEVPVIRQLAEAHSEYGTPVLAVEEVPPEKVQHYGIVEGRSLGSGVTQVQNLLEKPLPGESDSTTAIAGRYILTPDIFDALRRTKPGRNEEIQLTDALAGMVPNTSMVALTIRGRRFDIGNKEEYLRTILAFAMKREGYRDVVRTVLKEDPNAEGFP
jgi:UTP--glucose-1-phosphate uridylyltransferase